MHKKCNIINEAVQSQEQLWFTFLFLSIGPSLKKRFAGLRLSGAGLAAGAMAGVAQVGRGWKAYLTVDLGTFPSAQEAARAHDRYAVHTDGGWQTLALL